MHHHVWGETLFHFCIHYIHLPFETDVNIIDFLTQGYEHLLRQFETHDQVV